MSDVFFKGERAVKVNAKKVMWGATPKAQLYDIDGDEKWVSRIYSEYNEKEGTLIIVEWLYNILFTENEKRKTKHE
jgi:hypothetical protein